jgi:crotonobetainyl-CoA hydratase
MTQIREQDGDPVRVVFKMFQRRMRKPLIAAVNGLAHGGGLELVLACDLAICAQHATFALPEVKRGVLATGGGLVRLPGIIGTRRALEIALTGRTIDADTALDWGLVNAVVSAGTVRRAAVDLANEIASNAPLSVGSSKTVITEGATMPIGDAWALNDKHHLLVSTSADALEGPRAFGERRAPVWSGQ